MGPVSYVIDAGAAAAAAPSIGPLRHKRHSKTMSRWHYEALTAQRAQTAAHVRPDPRLQPALEISSRCPKNVCVCVWAAEFRSSTGVKMRVCMQKCNGSRGEARRCSRDQEWRDVFGWIGACQLRHSQPQSSQQQDLVWNLMALKCEQFKWEKRRNAGPCVTI